MDGPIITIEGGQVTANLEERTVTGLLIPVGEEGRTNIGRFVIASVDDIDTEDAEADPSIIGHKLDHDPTLTVATATKVWKQSDGVYATYRVAKTKAGDEYLADVTSGKAERPALSGEFGPASIKDGKLVPGQARVWGSGAVKKGAFPSAMVLASDTPDEDDARQKLAVEILTNVKDAVKDFDGKTPEPATADEDEEKEEETVEITTPAVADATVPAAPATVPGKHVEAAHVTPREMDLNQVVKAIAAVKAPGGDRSAEHALAQMNDQVLAALTDITFSGSNNLPGGGSVTQPVWVGQLHDGIIYKREYITLGKLGTQISAAGKKGFRINRGTSGSPILSPAGIPNGGTWQGNKTEINSYNGWTESASSTLRKFAVGNDIAREFYDLPGGEEVVRAFLELLFEDYAYWSDTNALNDINVNTQAPVVNATYPTPYPVAMGQLIQGILAVKKRKSDGRRDVPDFAIANDIAYAQLVYAAGGDTALPAFVNISIGTDSTGSADSIRVVQGDNGIQATSSVTVGASNSIQFDELPGGPLVVDALDIAKGGVDRAVHGYLQTFVNRPEALIRIGTADTFAQSTAYGVGRSLVYSGTQYVVTVAGTTAASNPTPPAVGATVVSGTATLLRTA
jgi:hypothetical protein